MVYRTRYITQGIAKVLIWMAALSTIGVMILILFQVLAEGLPVLHLRFLSRFSQKAWAERVESFPRSSGPLL